MNVERWSNFSSEREHDARSGVQKSALPIEASFEVAARCHLRCQVCAINYDSRYRKESDRPPFFEPELFARLCPMFPSCMDDTAFGNLFEARLEAIRNGEHFGEFRPRHAARPIPSGCGTCMRNGRQEQSPLFRRPAADRPLMERFPIASRAVGFIDAPEPNATSIEPLVVTGRLAPDIDPEDVELMIDETTVTRLHAMFVTDGNRFVFTANIPYLSEGVHIVWLRRREEPRGSAHRPFLFWRPESTAEESKA